MAYAGRPQNRAYPNVAEKLDDAKIGPRPKRTADSRNSIMAVWYVHQGGHGGYNVSETTKPRGVRTPAFKAERGDAATF